MKTQIKGFYSSDELAALLGLTRQGVIYNIKKGEIRAMRMGGGSYIIRSTEAQRVFQERRRS